MIWDDIGNRRRYPPKSQSGGSEPPKILASILLNFIFIDDFKFKSNINLKIPFGILFIQERLTSFHAISICLDFVQYFANFKTTSVASPASALSLKFDFRPQESRAKCAPFRAYFNIIPNSIWRNFPCGIFRLGGIDFYARHVHFLLPAIPHLVTSHGDIAIIGIHRLKVFCCHRPPPKVI